MKICRFLAGSGHPSVGLLDSSDGVIDLGAHFGSISDILELDDLPRQLDARNFARERRFKLNEVQLLAPVDRQEVWAAGVTYLRSKKARMAESDFSSSAYDRVYEAARPELFFKALAEKVVGPGGSVGIRGDAKWNVPEPELAVAFNSRGHLVGFTVGNDMSSRDIEGENLLYLPQAKTYRNSCALGPWLVLGVSEQEARTWEIGLTIERSGAAIFEGKTMVSQIKRTFMELGQYLFRCQEFLHGVVLLTGTGIVPNDDFTLQSGDRAKIEISGIGRLENSVTTV